MAWLSPYIAKWHNQLALKAGRRLNAHRTTEPKNVAPPRYNRIVLSPIRETPGRERLALVQMASRGFDRVLQGFTPTLFNPYGATAEMVRALNELGMAVDVIDALDTSFEPSQPYTVYVGHGSQFPRVAAQLSNQCLKVRYATGAHVTSFLAQSKERYQRFHRSRGLNEHDVTLERHVDASTDYSMADLIITLGERSAATFAQVGLQAVAIHNAAYVDEALPSNSPPRKWDQARKNFIYVSGTHGNVQKGLDRILEAFAGAPDLHLYIYSKLDEEILLHYPRELGLPNIHYAYHYAKFPRWRARLFRKCAFSICFGMNTGQSTAFLASMHEGFVPVYNVETDIPLPGCDLLVPQNTPESLRETIYRAAQTSPEELARQSGQARRLFQENHLPAAYRKAFKNHIATRLR